MSVIKQKFYCQEFDPTYKYFYRNDLEEYEMFFKPTVIVASFPEEEMNLGMRLT